jgi:hypothetical protein
MVVVEGALSMHGTRGAHIFWLKSLAGAKLTVVLEMVCPKLAKVPCAVCSKTLTESWRLESVDYINSHGTNTPLDILLS